MGQDFQGRLMTQAWQREAMDAVRFGRPVTTMKKKSAAKPPARVPSYTLDGMVVRDNHKHTLWINGRALQTDKKNPAKIRVHSHSVTVRDISGRRHRLKPGQRFDPNRGKVSDVFDHKSTKGAP